MDIDFNAQTAAGVVSGLGAANWGLVELSNYNIVTEILGADASGAAYLVIGLVGVVTITEELEITEFLDDG
jgi:uncharacterized membrane protein YuzA (DUF378 family)